MAEKVREVMTASPVMVTRDTPLTEVARMMREQGIGDVLVSQADGSLYGLATDRDIVIRSLADGQDPARTQIGEVCSSSIVSVSPEDQPDTAVRLMREHGIRRLPVTDDGHVIGIVTMGDLAMERDRRSALADISAAPPNT